MLAQSADLFGFKSPSHALHDLDGFFNGRFIPAQSWASHKCANICRHLWLATAGCLQSAADQSGELADVSLPANRNVLRDVDINEESAQDNTGGEGVPRHIRAVQSQTTLR